jgi:hypothetical protein
MARIAIGAVNHPLGAVRHSQLAIAARASIGLSNPLWVYAIAASRTIAAIRDLVHQSVEGRTRTLQAALLVSVVEQTTQNLTQTGRVGS